MLYTAGLSTTLALRLIDRTYDTQLERTAGSAENSRAIEKFEAKIGQISSVEELVADYDTYSFVMRAFDLESHMFGKAMIRRLLESDVDDRESLVNRLTDQRFKDLHAAMGFTEGGSSAPNFSDPEWQQGIVARYVEQQFINEQAEQNTALGTVLEFRQKLDGINNWYQVLRDAELTELFQTALGLPSSLSGLDVDRQAEILEDRMPIADLKDPEKVERLIARYTAISDAQATASGLSTNPIVQLMNGVGSGGNVFTPITIDIAAVQVFTSARYR